MFCHSRRGSAIGEYPPTRFFGARAAASRHASRAPSSVRPGAQLALTAALYPHSASTRAPKDERRRVAGPVRPLCVNSSGPRVDSAGAPRRLFFFGGGAGAPASSAAAAGGGGGGGGRG